VALLNIYIIDDHPLIIESVEHIVSKDSTLNVIGSSMNSNNLKAILNSNSIDVVILDINLPEESGVQVLKWLHENHPDIKVIVLTMHDSPLLLKRLLNNGARGYIVKQSGINEVINALRTVSSNDIYVCESMQNYLPGLDQIPTLSEREEDVLFHITNGRTIKETAAMMNLSPKTVETYRYRLTQKLNVSNIAELIKIAICLGLRL